jgi:hypothetical protein
MRRGLRAKRCCHPPFFSKKKRVPPASHQLRGTLFVWTLFVSKEMGWFFSSLTIRDKDWHIETTIKDQVFHYKFLSFSIRDDEPNPTGRSSLSLTSFLVFIKTADRVETYCSSLPNPSKTFSYLRLRCGCTT